MGQKVINDDLNVTGTIKHNGSEIPVGATEGIYLDPLTGVLRLDDSYMEENLRVVSSEEITFGTTPEDQQGMFAVCTGQSTEPYEVTLANDVAGRIYISALYHKPLSATVVVGSMTFPQLYSLFGNQYICANTSNITEDGITLVPYVTIIDPLNKKMTVYPWDKFFCVAGSGTGE